MKNKKIKKVCFIMSFVLVLFSTACSTKTDKKSENNSTITNTQGIEVDDLTTSEDITSEDTTSTDITRKIESQDSTIDTEETTEDVNVEAIERVETKEISIYTINESTLKVEVVPALILADIDITPKLIVDTVVDSLSDRLVVVGVDEVTTEKDTVIVSFLADKSPFTNAGSGLESTILDAFAQSLVDNLEDYPKVIFRVEGKPYASGHYEFGIDEVYLDRKGTN